MPQEELRSSNQIEGENDNHITRSKNNFNKEHLTIYAETMSSLPSLTHLIIAIRNLYSLHTDPNLRNAYES
jgi:hypothetical protein